MPDEASQGAAPQPVEQTAGQPAQQTAGGDQGNQNGQQAQQPQYSPDDVAKWQRGYEQYNGSRAILEQLGKAGIRSAEDFQAFASRAERYDNLSQTLGQHRLDPDTLTKMFSGGGGDEGQQENSTGELTLDSVRQVVGDEIRSIELKRQHDQHQAAERSAMEKAIQGIVGDDNGIKDTASQLFKMAVSNKIQSEPPLYPEGHPLANSAYRPLNQSEIGKIADDVKALLTSLRGQTAVSDANKALSGSPPASGQSPVSGGGGTDDNRPLFMRSKEERMPLVKQVFEQNRARLSNVPQPMR